MTAFKNTGNLPLSIVTSVCHSQDNPFGPKCHVSSVAYVAFSQWAYAILVYTLVYHMMEPPLELFNNISGVSNMNNLEFESLNDKNAGCNTESIRCLAEPKIVRKIRIVAESTPIQDAMLSFITDSLVILADAMVPSAMVVLGGMLAEGPNESNLGIRTTTIGIIVARLLVLPLVGIAVVLLADRLNLFVPGDQLYKYVLLLQYTTPSALLLGAIANLRGYVVIEASALLF
ncbi:hypothetical protein FEM48_Zijuj04G0178700 [Ziziphus jujuba var. spinosa]|uniref:Protein PIN-LIKES 3-like n=1 Tax=Ziziphus jujuba var. spinosa TaxID=714518 RepID=A0A978VLB2_ZIZJJ|nr:hypothetical protein FEM48_Zijuj04G0178700 [Ziziphus jujuba var. spinosa]